MSKLCHKGQLIVAALLATQPVQCAAARTAQPLGLFELGPLNTARSAPMADSLPLQLSDIPTYTVRPRLQVDHPSPMG